MHVNAGIAIYSFRRWRKRKLLRKPSAVSPKDIELPAAAHLSTEPAVPASHRSFAAPGSPASEGSLATPRRTLTSPAALSVRGSAAEDVPRRSPRAVLQQVQAPQVQTQVALVQLQRCSVLASGKVSLSVQIQQEGMRVLAVEVRESQAETAAHLLPFWRPLSNLQADTWELLSFRLRQPFDMRITSSAGKQVVIRDVVKAFSQQQPAVGPSVIQVNFSSLAGPNTAGLQPIGVSPESIGMVESMYPEVPSILRPTPPSAMPVPSRPAQFGEYVADPLWRTSDTLDMPGYDCDPARLQAELEDALETNEDVNVGQPDNIHATMSRISKELEDVESNPSDIVLTAQSMAPFFDTRHQRS
ncbi:hypothetical protein WJX84_003024 [Apatococcus fuscideae]|uniref:Uncharacterized protein n=1 Tax=Apatococcus fuscideae TaxID=2026836 RepID=A0AAW1T3S2_9CHLO